MTNINNAMHVLIYEVKLFVKKGQFDYYVKIIENKLEEHRETTSSETIILYLETRDYYQVTE